MRQKQLSGMDAAHWRWVVVAACSNGRFTKPGLEEIAKMLSGPISGSNKREA